MVENRIHSDVPSFLAQQNDIKWWWNAIVPIFLALGWLHLRLHVFAHGQLTLETQLQLLRDVDSIDLSTGCQTRLSGDDWYVYINIYIYICEDICPCVGKDKEICVCVRTDSYLCMYACMYVCMYVCNVCMHVCMHACMYACLYVCMSVYVCMYVCMHLCMYVIVNICIYIYVDTQYIYVYKCGMRYPIFLYIYIYTIWYSVLV